MRGKPYPTLAPSRKERGTELQVGLHSGSPPGLIGLSSDSDPPLLRKERGASRHGGSSTGGAVRLGGPSGLKATDALIEKHRLMGIESSSEAGHSLQVRNPAERMKTGYDYHDPLC